jgi:hypothetical protein
MNSPGYDFLSTIAYIKDREMTLSVAKEKDYCGTCRRIGASSVDLSKKPAPELGTPSQQTPATDQFHESFLLF